VKIFVGELSSPTVEKIIRVGGELPTGLPLSLLSRQVNPGKIFLTIFQKAT
jgi:hypothetical protein